MFNLDINHVSSTLSVIPAVHLAHQKCVCVILHFQTTGVPIRASKKAQINILINRISGFP